MITVETLREKQKVVEGEFNQLAQGITQMETQVTQMRNRQLELRGMNRLIEEQIVELTPLPEESEAPQQEEVEVEASPEDEEEGTD